MIPVWHLKSLLYQLYANSKSKKFEIPADGGLGHSHKVPLDPLTAQNMRRVHKKLADTVLGGMFLGTASTYLDILYLCKCTASRNQY